MAQIPNEQDVLAAQDAAAAKIEEKRLEQQAEGKDFIVPENGHAAGVIPEEVWKGLKV